MFNKYDNLAKFITVAVWIGVLYIVIRNFFVYNSYLKLAVINSILIAVLVVPYLFSPKGILIENDRIIIRRVLGNIIIPLRDVAEIKLLPSIPTMRLRLFGSGGLYGYFGYFYLPNLGTVRIYATRRYDLVLIRCKDGRTYVISPEFVEECCKKLKIKPN